MPTQQQLCCCLAGEEKVRDFNLVAAVWFAAQQLASVP